jgi:hypothetical protein
LGLFLTAHWRQNRKHIYLRVKSNQRYLIASNLKIE